MAGEQVLYNRPLPGARLNMAHPMAKGLVGCWLMNESGSRLMDLSPYGNHGLLSGNFKRSFRGVTFPGADVKADCGSSDILDSLGTIAPYKFMMEAWIRPDSLGEANLGTIIEKGTILYRMTATQTMNLRVNFSGGFKNVTAPNNSAPLKSILFTTTFYDGANLKLYINRNLTTGDATTGAIDSHASTSFYIGDNTTSIRCFDGVIYLIRIWNLIPFNNAEEAAKALYISPYAPLGTPMFI